MPRWGARHENLAESPTTHVETLDLSGCGEIESTVKVLPVVGSCSPPQELRDMTCEGPAAGYASHKGCLFPVTLKSGSVLSSTARTSRWSRNREPIVAPSAMSADDVGGQLEGSSNSRFVTDSSKRNRKRNERKARNRAIAQEHQNGIDCDKNKTAVVWLRDDMRLDDNPVLAEASKFQAVVCVYIHDIWDPSPWPLRGAALWWKSESLRVFSQTLKSIGSQLYIQAGVPADVLCEISLQVDADVVMWNRRCEPWYRESDLQVEKACDLNGLIVRTFKADVLWEPWEARPDERSYDRGFGSVGFYRSAVEELGEVPEPIPSVTTLPGLPSRFCKALTEICLCLEDLGYHLTAGRGFPRDMRNYNEERQRADLGPLDDWAIDMKRCWAIGEQAAWKRLRVFLQEVLAEGMYEGFRDKPDS